MAESFLKKGARLGNDFFKGSKAFNFTEGYKYAIKYAKSGAVYIAGSFGAGMMGLWEEPLSEETCKRCEIKFKIRKYRREDYCQDCSKLLHYMKKFDEFNAMYQTDSDGDDGPDEYKDNFDMINAMYEADYQDDDKKVNKYSDKDEDPDKDKKSNEISKKSD